MESEEFIKQLRTDFELETEQIIQHSESGDLVNNGGSIYAYVEHLETKLVEAHKNNQELVNALLAEES